MPNIFHAQLNQSTLDDVIDEGANRRRRWLSLATMAAIAVFVLAALFGAFDQRGTISASSPKLALEVEYPSVVRAGDEVDLAITVSSAEPLPATFELILSQDYLQLFEDLAIWPDPEAQSADGQGKISFEISATPGATGTVVHFTGRASDQWSPRTTGILELELAGQKLATPLQTWRIP